MTADIKSPSVISLPRPSGRVTLFNTSRTDIVPLKKVSKQEMLELLAAFRIELRRWLLGELCVPRYDLDIKRMGGTAPGLLAGLSGSLMRVPGPNSGHAYRWDLFYLQTGKSSNRSLALAERHSPVSRGTQRTSVLNMPIESQVEYLKSIVGENGEYAFEVAEPTLAARYAAAHLEEALSSAESVPEFLVATVTALGRGTTDGERRIPSTDLGTMMFLAFLHRHGLVLLPASCVYFRWNELRTDPFCFPEWLEQHLRALLVYMGERKRTTFTPQQLLRQARAVHLMSTLSEPADISADLCHRFRDLHPKQPRVVWATNMLVRGTKAILASPQQHALRVEAMRTADLLQLSKRAAQDTAPAKNPRSAIDRFPSEPGDKRDVLSADSPDCIGIPRPGGEADIIVNTSVHSLVVLKSTDKAGMEDLIRQFRCEQRQWLMRELSLPREDLTPLRARAGAPSLLYGLSGTFDSTDRKHSDRWRFRNIALVGEQGTAAIAFARQWPPPPGGSPLSSVLRMPQEAQLTFLRHVLGQNGEFALESLSPRFAQSFACRELEAWLGESTGTGEFLARVMRRAVARGDDSGPGGRDEIGPVLFLTFLRSREIILLPAAAYVFRWSTICSSPLPFFAPWLLEHAERVMLALRSEALTPFREQGLQKAIRALWLMSSVSKPCDIAPALCDALRTVLKPQPEAGGALSTLVETMAHLLGHVAPGERLSRKARLLLRPECGHAPGGQSHLGNDRAQPGGTYSATSLVLSPDSEHILRCDTRNDNQQTLLNTSADALVMLRKIGRREMISYISDFRKEQTGWLMSLLEAPRRDISWRTVGEDYPELIYGLSGALSDATRQHGFEKEWMLYHLSRGGPARDAAREFLSGRPTIPGGTARTALLLLTREEQLQYLHLFTGNHGEHLLSVVRSGFSSRYACPDLEAWLAGAPDVPSFLASLLPSLENENTQRRDNGSAMFLAYLRRLNLVLLPTKAMHVRWNAVHGRRNPWLPGWFEEHLAKIVERSRFAERTQFQDADLLRSARALYLISSVQDARDITDVLCQSFKDLFKARNDVGWAINTLSDTTMAAFGEPVIRGASALRRPGDLRKAGRSPFDWVRDGTLDGRFKRKSAYTPRPELFPWADLMDTAIGLVKVKDLHAYRGTATLFLEYLATLEKVPATLADVRADVHIYDMRGTNRTFRDYIASMHELRGKGGLGTRNGHLYRWNTLFNSLCSYHDLKIPNPLNMKQARFIEAGSRKRTVRSAMDPDLVEIVRDFNSRDDFAFSRAITKHYRAVNNPETGRVESHWFPAVAIAIDVLLELPFRSHCVRYMDTGQGDQLRFDRASRTMVRNPARPGEPGRAEGVIQFVDGRTRQEKKILGIHLATNKTAVGEYQGRDVPYLPSGLERNLLRMIAWSEKYYPIEEPVLAEPESYLHEQRADEVQALIPRIYPVFRDPARRDGQPVSREIIMDYWHTLCAAVEDRINEARDDSRRIVLTHVVEGKRKAVFDIHSMRVTGITNMLKRGMPPDLIQMVVGHACLVMTLYYRDITMRELEVKLRDWYKDREISRERLRQIPLSELGDHVFNLMSGEVIEEIAGSTGVYQRAWGPSWKLLAHGICPGGDCGDGGEYRNGAYSAVRPTACSICRHRLTGPAFLAGLAANANLLLYQMRREAEALQELQGRKYTLEDEGRPTSTIEGEMQQARLRFEDYALEWLAEVQYVHKAVAMVESPDGDGGGKALVSPQPKEALLARLESRGHEFHLLQSITTAAELQPWKPPAVARAILEQHEFIDQVLDANGVGPLLCKLPKHERLVSANKLGELLTKYVPDSEFDNVASGRTLFAQVVPPQVRGLLSDAVSELAHLVPQGVLIDCRSGRAAPHSALVSA